ncbi:MAG: hypothetical protein KJ559_02185 [Nanoarchaeota archaeon]|nr:hypothetical protein [Nanoarchaeota archaeon]
MGINIIDKVLEFTFDSGTKFKGKITIPTEQLRKEKCRYTFVVNEEIKTFLGTMGELWNYHDNQRAVVKTMDGEKQELPARLYIVSKEQEPTDKLGAYLPTVKRIE